MLIDERWDTLVQADNGCETSVAVVQCAKAEEEGKEREMQDFDKCKTKKSERVIWHLKNKNVNIMTKNVKCVRWGVFSKVNAFANTTLLDGIFQTNSSYGSKKNLFRRLRVYYCINELNMN